MRISREQFQKEEDERNRLKNVQRLKEQHKKYEQSLPPTSETTPQLNSSKITEQLNRLDEASSSNAASVFSSIASSIVNSTSTPSIGANTPSVLSTSSSQPQSQPQSSWRNLVGAGNAPKLNVDTEFPSLGGGHGNSLSGGKFWIFNRNFYFVYFFNYFL